MKKLIVFAVLFVCFSMRAQDTVADRTGTVFTMKQVDKYPQYPGGEIKFLQYLRSNFRLPENDGVINIRFGFVIEKDGSMSNVTVINDVSDELREEVVRLISNCPEKWKPAVNKKTVVRSVYENTIKISITKYE